VQDSCDFFGSRLDLDICSIFEKNWIRTGSGYWLHFYNEIFLRVIQVVTNDGSSVFLAMVFIFGSVYFAAKIVAAKGLVERK